MNIHSLCCLNVCELIDHHNECLLFSHCKGFNENKKSNLTDGPFSLVSNQSLLINDIHFFINTK